MPQTRDPYGGLEISRDYEPGAQEGIREYFQEIMPWTQLANCRGIGQKIFQESFAEGVKGQTHSDHFPNIDEARDYCRDCPVLKKCADWAIQNENAGIWAGYNPQELRATFNYPVNYDDIHYTLSPPQEVKDRVCGAIEQIKQESLPLNPKTIIGLSMGQSQSPIEHKAVKRSIAELLRDDRIEKLALIIAERLKNEHLPVHEQTDSPKEIEAAIANYAAGKSMSQASKEMGMEKGWLSTWKYNHPEKFKVLLASALRESGLEERVTLDPNLDRAQQAIELHARGMPMNQASLEVGRSASWLALWKYNHPEKFESLLAQALEKAGLEERAVTPREPRNLDRYQQAVDLYASGTPMTQASKEVGKNGGWLSTWKYNHPEKFKVLLASALRESGLEERVTLDPNLDQRKKAVELHAGGKSMSQASLEVGRSASWLALWKYNHPQKFESLLAQSLEKAGLEERAVTPREPRNLDRYQQAVDLYASGTPMTQASKEMGMEKGWLSTWKYNHPEKFESLLTQALKKAGLEERKLCGLDRYQQAVDLYARGTPITQASQEMGMEKSWLSTWKHNHPEKFESLLTQSLEKAGLEERLSTPNSLDSNLASC